MKKIKIISVVFFLTASVFYYQNCGTSFSENKDDSSSFQPSPGPLSPGPPSPGPPPPKTKTNLLSEINCVASTTLLKHSANNMGYTDRNDFIRSKIPEIKRMGFNTVWLVNRWDEFDEFPLGDPSPRTFNNANFTTLRETLEILKANNLKAFIGLNYLGATWGPTFSGDADTNDDLRCHWLTTSNVYQAFEEYVIHFLGEIQDYSNNVFILMFSESARPCNEQRKSFRNTRANGPQTALYLRDTLGSLPNRIPKTLRDKFIFGYHDNTIVTRNYGQGASPVVFPNPYDFVSFSGYYYTKEVSEEANIIDLYQSRLNRFIEIFGNSTPIILGEFGVSLDEVDNSQEKQRDLVIEMLNFAINKNIGFNVWGFHHNIPVPGGSKLTFYDAEGEKRLFYDPFVAALKARSCDSKSEN